MSEEQSKKAAKRAAKAVSVTPDISGSKSLIPSQEAYSTADFFLTVKRLGWKVFFQKLPAEDLIITVPAFRDELVTLCGELECGIVELPHLESALPKYSGRLILFLPRHERVIMKSLKTYQPNRRVYSVITDLLPNSIHRPATLSWRRPPEPVPAETKDEVPGPVFIIGTPGSEVSYFADMYERSGLGTVRPYFPEALPVFKSMTGNFPILRYLKAVTERYAEEGAFTAYIYADVVKQMLDTGMFTVSKLVSYLEQTNARIIYYSMRDKVRQAIYAATFQERITESVWELSKDAQSKFRAPSISSIRLVRTLMPLIEQDMAAEQLMRALPGSFYVGHEDLVMSPREVMAGVSNFIKRPITHEVASDWHEVTAAVMPNLEADSDKLTRTIIDRLGLHTNASGSLVSLQQLVNEVVSDRMAEQGGSGR